MRVLDIDLDFFLTDVCPFAEKGARPDDNCAQPLPEASVRRFLEVNCGLSRVSPLPGRVFETHEGALLYWQELIDAGRLLVPFEVTHVDAHSDLGIAQKGYPYVKNAVLCRPPEERAELDKYLKAEQLNEANYLVFALALRYISRLENIRNPKSRKDLPEEMREGEFLRLKSAFPALFEAKYGEETKVPYCQYDTYTEYKTEAPFDFISLALSPRYAPKTADGIKDIIADYMLLV